MNNKRKMKKKKTGSQMITLEQDFLHSEEGPTDRWVRLRNDSGGEDMWLALRMSRNVLFGWRGRAFKGAGQLM
jgi:hypothetical protein